ncbi:MAG: dTMP kinase [Myxococcales bacterium]|nr:dTMP kinase [Myxococcales bacterium]
MEEHGQRRGLLIVLEGVDGAGKTTQADAIEAWVRASGRDVVRSREPTQGVYGQRLRRSMLEGRLEPEEELELFLNDRREHVEQVIAPALEAGAVVVLDRYYFSTVAYQGARGFDCDELMARNEAFAPAPDLLLILDLEPEQGIGRVRARSDQPPDTFEIPDKLRRSRAIFLQLGARLPYAEVIDAGRGCEAVREEILGHVRALTLNSPAA